MASTIALGRATPTSSSSPTPTTPSFAPSPLQRQAPADSLLAQSPRAPSPWAFFSPSPRNPSFTNHFRTISKKIQTKPKRSLKVRYTTPMLSQTPPPTARSHQAPRQPVPPAPFTGTAPGLLAPHQAEILSAFLRGMSILELSRASSTPLPQLLAFLGSPEAQAVIADFENMLSLQWRLISLGAQAQAIRALERVCDSRNSPVETRRAATEILRLPECRTAPPARTRTRSDANDTRAANRTSVHHNTANSSHTNQSPANPIPERTNLTHTQPASDSRASSGASSPMGTRVGGGGTNPGVHAIASEIGGRGRTDNTTKNAPIPAPSNPLVPHASPNSSNFTESILHAAPQPARPSAALPTPTEKTATVRSPAVQHPSHSRPSDPPASDDHRRATHPEHGPVFAIISAPVNPQATTPLPPAVQKLE